MQELRNTARNGRQNSWTPVRAANGKCADCLLYGKGFCQSVDADIPAINQSVRLRRVRCDEVLFQQGETASFAGVLRSGILRIEHMRQDGDRLLLGLVFPGTIFGVFDRQNHICSLEAAADSEVCIFQPWMLNVSSRTGNVPAALEIRRPSTRVPTRHDLAARRAKQPGADHRLFADGRGKHAGRTPARRQPDHQHRNFAKGLGRLVGRFRRIDQPDPVSALGTGFGYLPGAGSLPGQKPAGAVVACRAGSEPDTGQRSDSACLARIARRHACEPSMQMMSGIA